MRRRGLLAVVALSVLGVLALVPGVTSGAPAAAGTVPPSVRELEAAAMALYEAAEAEHWPDAQRALDQARKAADAIAGLESAYVNAGGQLAQFYVAQNGLGADVIEANTALSVKDRRWLVSSADRLLARAGELSQPFAKAIDAVTPRVEVLLFLARRMRTALVWQDAQGFERAHDDFVRAWRSLRGKLPRSHPESLRALDDAIARVSVSRSSADLKALESAVLALPTPTRR